VVVVDRNVVAGGGNAVGFVVGESAGDAAVAVAEKVVGVLGVAANGVQTGGWEVAGGLGETCCTLLLPVVL
jgi:hypothetical protein